MAAPCLLLVLFKYLLTSWPLQGCILTVLALDLSPVLPPSKALVTSVEVLSGLSGACGAVSTPGEQEEGEWPGYQLFNTPHTPSRPSPTNLASVPSSTQISPGRW